MKKIIPIILAIALLSSCSVVPGTENGNLLVAPLLNQVQGKIYEALSKTLDINTISYVYPKAGEHRSPFVFYDLDGDGKDEVVLFYSPKDSPNQAFARVMIEDEAGWDTLYEIAGKGDQIDFVEFAPVLETGKNSVVIGWNNSVQDRIICVYDFLEAQLEPVLETQYIHHTITRPTSGLSQLFLVRKGEGAFKAVSYKKEEGVLKPAKEVALYEETNAVPQLLLGELADGRQALYIDEELGGVTSYATEVLAIEGYDILVVAGSTDGKAPDDSAQPKWQAYSQTFRMDRVLSQDLGEDGKIEVPRTRDITDYMSDVDSNKDGVPKLIEYMRFDKGYFHVAYTAAINERHRYMVYFPDRWIGNVTIVEYPQRQEWRFYKTTPAGTGVELLRIRVFYASDYIDAFTKDDILLATQGLFSYYAYIPQTEREPLAVTTQEVEGVFELT